MTEQAKTAQAPPPQEQSYPPTSVMPYPHQAYNGATFPPAGPPGGYMPPMFAYPPPPEGAHPEGQNGSVGAPPYMMALPPGVVYAYPPPAQATGSSISISDLGMLLNHQLSGFTAPPPPPSTTSTALTRPKRKQVKMAVRFLLFFFPKVRMLMERSAPIVLALASVVMKIDPANVVSSTAQQTPVLMGSGKRGRKV